MSANDRYHSDLERVRDEDQESYNKLKISLENHVQLLEQQLAEIRAMYQLNTEKLNYNFQVLKEREKENITTVDHLKRREKKLKESNNNIREKFAKFDKKYKSEYKVLNDEYIRISKQYKELQRKFKHFQNTDTMKYDEIVDMNQNEAVRILEAMMKCDQIISSQLLGVEWDYNAWDIPQSLTKQLFETFNDRFHTKINTKIEFEQEPEQKEKNESLHEDDTESLHKMMTDSNISKKVQLESSNKYTTEQILNVIKLLIIEAPFLISAQIKESLHFIPSDQHLLFQCDSILKNLGIEEIEDLEEFISLFFKNDNDENISIQPHETIQIVKKYVSDRDHTKTADIHTTNFSVKHALTSASREKQERRKRKDSEYWKNLQNVFPAKNKKTWLLLEQYLIKYNHILEKRKSEAIKIINLQNENHQLTELLQQYLSSDANKELIIPPSLIIDAQQQHSQQSEQ